MMHHPNMHHQPMSGHPQHLPSHQLQAHHQMPPPQMHRDSRHVTLARMPLGPGQAGGMAHTQMGGMGAMGVPHHAPQRPPHPIRPMHHPQQHHTVPQQMKPLRRPYMGGGYGAGGAPSMPQPYAPPPPMQPPPTTQPPGGHKRALLPPAPAPINTPQTSEAPAEPTNKEAAAAGDADSPRPAAAQANSKEKTPMCLVNELARYNKIKHQYRLTSETGPAHKKVFTVTLRLGDTEEYTAEGSSIKRAQHAAAAAALAGSGYPAPPPRAPLPHNHHAPPRHSVMPTVELNALAMKLCEPAVYTCVPPVAGVGRAPRAPRPPYRLIPFHCPPALTYRVRVSVGGRAWLGEGATPQAARHDAAARALRDLKQAAPPPAPPDPAHPPHAAHPPHPAPAHHANGNIDGTSAEELLNCEVKSPVSLVHELALKRNLVVTFSVKCERGPPHMRVFVTACTVGEMETEGEGNGKKVSKRRAAEKMLDEMRTRWGGAALPRRPVPRKHQPTKRKPRNLVKVGGVCAEAGAGGADNPISRLAVARHAVRARSPHYTLLEERGAARRREFLVQCDAPPHAATGRGPNKKTAKRRAAMNVLLAMEMANGTSDGENPLNASSDTPVNGGGDNKPNGVDVKRKEGDITTGGGCGEVRQPVPGVLLMDYHPRPAHSTQLNGVSESSTLGSSNSTGTSPSTGGNSPGAKDQLMYLSQLLGFSVQFSDFPKRNHGEYLSLVSLGTEPPVMCHGGGASTARSHEQCARAALRALELMGLEHTPPAAAAAAAVAADPADPADPAADDTPQIQNASKPGVMSNVISE